MCFFNLERYRKISGLKMRQEDLKSLMTFIYIVGQNMSRSVSQCWGLVINKRVDCILWCLYATRECVQHLWLIKLTKECTLRQIKNRKIFITLISLRLQFGAVFKDLPTSNSNWQTNNRSSWCEPQFFFTDSNVYESVTKESHWPTLRVCKNPYMDTHSLSNQEIR